MKRTKKFLLLFLLLAILFSGIGGAVAAVFLSSARNDANDAVLQIAANVREQHPDITPEDLAAILNGNSDTASTAEALRSFGIRQEDWIVLRSRSADTAAILAGAGACAATAAACVLVFLLYTRSRKRETLRLTNYLSQINDGDYHLVIKENKEEESSVLQNEIYKTTVMLRESAERDRAGKAMLKDALSDISHQLKTPLTSIIITVDNLLDDEDMPEDIRREFLQDIRRSSGNIRFLVQSLLTLSRLDADSIVLKSASESVQELFEDCVRGTAILAELRGVQVIVGGGDLLLNCDRRWIVEALTNIVKNCVEHTPAGGTVTLTAEENKLYTKIVIKDTGSGISPKDLPHIFERFFKGQNDQEDSIGIGLALAKAIVEKSGGFISADSELGKGTCFTLKFFHSAVPKRGRALPRSGEVPAETISS